MYHEKSPLVSYGGYEEEGYVSGGAYDCTTRNIVIVIILAMLWYNFIYLPNKRKNLAPLDKLNKKLNTQHNTCI
jgi:hypothetical protein